MSEASADAVYRASADVLSAAAQIETGSHLPHADGLRQNMLALLRDFVSRCREAGIPDTETAEARYALVAFIDDRVLRSNWAGRTEWMSNPLQLQFFREYTAGENFFARMRVLTQRGGPFWALEVYYLCIALGFVGALPAGGGSQSARTYADPARPQLLGGRNPTWIAPNAIPPEQHRARRKPLPMALAAIAACAVLCLAALLGLHYALGGKIQHVTRDLTAARTAPPAGGGP
jgi:type IV/VI secretion system ImpK/VasF family protein